MSQFTNSDYIPGYLIILMLQINNISQASHQPPIPKLLKHKQRNRQIRQNIDKTIHQLYHQLSLHKYHNHIMPIIKTQLVLQYINTIHTQYNLPDPFNSHQKTQKKAVHLKQCFLQELSESTLRISSGIKATGQSTIRGHINPVFRYCFMCEQPILQGNIDIHQRQQCTDFELLYGMDIQQIHKILKLKLTRIRQCLQKCLNALQQQQMQNKHLVTSSYREYLKELETMVESEKSLDPNSLSERISKNNQKYIQIMELTEKLYWFGVMYKTININKPVKTIDQLFQRIHLPTKFK